MSDNRKNYKILIKTHAPLHIGSGKTINKKEYIFDEQRKKAYMINLQKLALLISRKNLFDSYERYMCGHQNYDLGAWLKINGVTQHEIDSIIDYVVDCGNTKISRKKRAIHTFVKDAYGNPYIPGSSLKGYLRTALMAYEIKKNPERYGQIKDNIRNSDLRGRPKELEIISFYNANRKNDDPAEDRENAVNDIMQGIIIGDSKPISTDHFTLCQKCDFKKDGRYSERPIYYECIIPEIKIIFPLTIDSSFCDITAGDIGEAVKSFASDYYENFLSAFGRPKYRFSNTMWLGGNVGYPLKTVVYNLFGRDEGVGIVSDILTAVGHSKNGNDKEQYGVSPHTLKTVSYNGFKHLMGECTITVKEV